jgi:hypothetical protein
MKKALSYLYEKCAGTPWVPTPNPGGFDHADISKTVLKDPGGKPVKFFHATTAPFAVFNPLSHFGTQKAAQERMEKVYLNDPDYQRNGYFGLQYDARYVEVNLNIQNPLRIPDLGAERSDNCEQTLKDLKILSAQECDQVFRSDPQEWKSLMVGALMKKGYDAFVYKNDVEDAGSDSYIVFRPEQVRTLGSIKVHKWGMARKLIDAVAPPKRNAWTKGSIYSAT